MKSATHCEGFYNYICEREFGKYFIENKLFHFKRIDFLPTLDSCENTPCQNDATCLSNFDLYTCLCHPGYTGTHCETNIDDCSPNPCKNAGQCTDLIDAYTCSCAAGFTDFTCSTEIDECQSEPCHNGNCNDHINSYSCACHVGFSGDLCEISK